MLRSAISGLRHNPFELYKESEEPAKMAGCLFGASGFDATQLVAAELGSGASSSVAKAPRQWRAQPRKL